jgi:MraZ protein
VVIPENILKAGGIDGTGVFVGKGATFEIWSPAEFAKHQAASRELALKKRLTLKADPVGGAQ